MQGSIGRFIVANATKILRSAQNDAARDGNAHHRFVGGFNFVIDTSSVTYGDTFSHWRRLLVDVLQAKMFYLYLLKKRLDLSLFKQNEGWF